MQDLCSLLQGFGGVRLRRSGGLSTLAEILEEVLRGFQYAMHEALLAV